MKKSIIEVLIILSSLANLVSSGVIKSARKSAENSVKLLQDGTTTAAVIKAYFAANDIELVLQDCPRRLKNKLSVRDFSSCYAENAVKGQKQDLVCHLLGSQLQFMCSGKAEIRTFPNNNLEAKTEKDGAFCDELKTALANSCQSNCNEADIQSMADNCSDYCLSNKGKKASEQCKNLLWLSNSLFSPQKMENREQQIKSTSTNENKNKDAKNEDNTEKDTRNAVSENPKSKKDSPPIVEQGDADGKSKNAEKGVSKNSAENKSGKHELGAKQTPKQEGQNDLDKTNGNDNNDAVINGGSNKKGKAKTNVPTKAKDGNINNVVENVADDSEKNEVAEKVKNKEENSNDPNADLNQKKKEKMNEPTNAGDNNENNEDVNDDIEKVQDAQVNTNDDLKAVDGNENDNIENVKDDSNKIQDASVNENKEKNSNGNIKIENVKDDSEKMQDSNIDENKEDNFNDNNNIENIKDESEKIQDANVDENKENSNDNNEIIPNDDDQESTVSNGDDQNEELNGDIDKENIENLDNDEKVDDNDGDNVMQIEETNTPITTMLSTNYKDNIIDAAATDLKQDSDQTWNNDNIQSNDDSEEALDIKSENMDDPQMHSTGMMNKYANVKGDQTTLMSYLVIFACVCIIGYLLFHNKQKIFALLLEGRRKEKCRGRHSSAQYRKLDNNLEEAMGPHSTDSLKHIIY